MRRVRCSRGHALIDQAAEELAVKEILRTNDAVLVSAVEALLEGAYIPYLVLDQNMSVLEGSLGILPRRVLVEDRCLKSARRLLEDAGLARERPSVPPEGERPGPTGQIGNPADLSQAPRNGIEHETEGDGKPGPSPLGARASRPHPKKRARRPRCQGG